MKVIVCTMSGSDVNNLNVKLTTVMQMNAAGGERKLAKYCMPILWIFVLMHKHILFYDALCC